MDAKTLEILQNNADLDQACAALLRLALEAKRNDYHGETTVTIRHRGARQPTDIVTATRHVHPTPPKT